MFYLNVLLFIQMWIANALLLN